ncbi:hypothetical protein DCC85_07315 [Paenibacillus sp. CAA11]|uniref:FkbM family methyltransferase n=1 Tax=Paenibacillus sp. CAA11 TaxID=1532905 RepID=UPI000D34FF0D|nr:FkbM family methyltransferase [Paenibacillus sp. CAA11]AWB44042.1 hypothetical protein DCC85_07315 [Paenibacillus sp. CAA11]
MEERIVDLQSGNHHFKMKLQLPGFVEDIIAERKGWEPHLVRELSSRMEDGGIFLDVGANIGYHSLYIAAANPAATCISFEPHPRIYHQFEENIALNGLPNIHAYCQAVGQTAGTLPFYMQDDSCYNRALSSSICYEVLQNGTSMIEVPVVPLDEALTDEQKKKVKVLKVDTQGVEYEVFAGAQRLLEIARPIVTFEHHPYASHNLADTLELLPDYRVYRIYSWFGGTKPFDEADPEMYVDELDLLCIPNELSV